MDESLRDRYLQGMGISQWYPRKPLPGAKPSRLPGPEPELSAHGKQQPEADVVTASMSSEQIPAGADTPLPGKDVSAGSQSGNEAEKVLSEPPRFRLQGILFTGQCLVINDATPENEFIQESGSMRLLNDILLALGIPVSREPVVRYISWPILRNIHIDQGADVARDATRAFIDQQLAGQAVRYIILMGENAKEFAMPGIKLTDSTRHLTEYRLIVTRSLSEMIKSPLCKRDVWVDLQCAQPN